MLFRSKVFDAVGPFSTYVGRIGSKLMGHDDTEFGIRATSQLLGTKIIYEPAAIVLHKVSANRVNIKYVLKRSYAEGFSKSFVSKTPANKSIFNTEKSYLRTLFANTPSILFRGRSGPSQCGILWIATLMVFKDI